MRLKPLPIPYQNRATAISEVHHHFCGFLASLIFSRSHHVVWQDLSFQLLRAHLRFPPGPLTRTTSLQPLEEPSSAQIASRLPLKTNWSVQTHTQQMRRRLLEKIYGAGQLHILWLKGRRVHLIFGDGWYLWQVILEGGSPLLHRSPPLPCLMDITRCPRPNLQFWFWFSPDKKVDIFWYHLMSQPSNFTVFSSCNHYSLKKQI